MRTSVFCFAADLADEGVEPVLDNVQGRAGLGGVTLATVYHAARDVFPHDPRWRCATSRTASASSRPTRRRYRGLALQPRVSRLVEESDPLAELLEAAGRRAASTCIPGRSSSTSTGWTRTPRLGEQQRVRRPDADRALPRESGRRAPMSVRSTGDIASRGVAASLLAESLHYHPLEHGYHHERYFLPLGARTRFLLGLCFCEHCLAGAGGEASTAELRRLGLRGGPAHAWDGGPDGDDELPRGGRGSPAAIWRAAGGPRREAVATLVRELAAATAGARAYGSTLLDASRRREGLRDGLPDGDAGAEIAWRLGVDLAAGAQPARNRRDRLRRRPGTRAARPRRLPRTRCPTRPSAALRPAPPDCDSAENLAAKLRVAARTVDRSTSTTTASPR